MPFQGKRPRIMAGEVSHHAVIGAAHENLGAAAGLNGNFIVHIDGNAGIDAAPISVPAEILVTGDAA